MNAQKNENESFDIAALLKQNEGRNYELHSAHVNPSNSRTLSTIGFDRCYVRAEGPYLWDVDGTKYLDMLAGYGVFGLGRNNPDVRKAISDFLALDYPSLVKMEAPLLSGLLAAELKKRMPNQLDMVFFTNSGSEGIETALKYARCATKRPGIVYCEKAFHGLTYGSLSLNGDANFREGFEPFLTDCRKIPFNDLAALEQELARGDVAAFVVEPIQGKGVYVAPDNYLPLAAEACHAHGALFCADEVQTGLGRTGTFFAFEQWDVEPDLVTIAKALSGGYVPVGAVIAKSQIVETVFDKMDRAVVHSSTFSQNVLAMTAGLATLQTLDEEEIIDNAATVGGALMSNLKIMADKHELVHEIRGRGLMIGIEFHRPKSRSLRAQWSLLETMRSGLFTQMVVVPLFRDHAILSQVAGDHQNVLKILPPLITTDEQADAFVEAMGEVLTRLERSAGLLVGVARSLALPALRARG